VLSIFLTLVPNCLVHAAPLSPIPQINEFLAAHNGIRAAHNSSALTWSDEFAAKAANWVDACVLQLTGGILSDIPYGELQVAASGSFSIQDALNTFIQDEPNYNPVHPVLSHFTQVVWKATTQVGCAVKQCKDLLDPRLVGNNNGTSTPNKLHGTYYVCLYNPPGNVVGEEKHNVQL